MPKSKLKQTKSFRIRGANVWIYPGMAAWHFVTIPNDISTKIKNVHKGGRRGWGSIPVTVTLGMTSWKTSIFPDGKTGTYLLPLKKEVRKAEKILEGERVSFCLLIS